MSLAPGQTVLHYRLIEKIGEGGMGVVWKAEDVDLGRAVALKVLPDSFVGETDRAARFEQEARMLAALNHPNIATIHGFERAGATRMLVMEYVDGADVASRLAGGPWSFEQALPLFEQMAEALEAAHQRDIVHRDLKPQNLKVTPAGRVKVLDFGLAKALSPLPGESSPDEAPTLTRAATVQGAIVGTANYMSPEQLRDLPLDGRSDLFQLGMVFSQMLTGRHPFAGPTTVDVQHAILHDPPHAVSFPSAPPEFSRILAKLLEKNRDYRYPDARALLVDLRTLRRDSVSDVGASPFPGARSNRRLRVAVASLGVVALVLAVWWLWPREQHSPLPDRLVPLLGVGGKASDPSFSPDGSRVVFASDREGEWDLWIALVGGEDPIRITDTPGVESRPVWSPDGGAIAFARARPGGSRSDIYIMPALGGVPRKLAEDASGPSFSPDGRWLVYADGSAGWTRIGKLALDDPDHPAMLTPAEEGYFQDRPVWSPTGSWIVFTRSAGGASGRLWRMLPDGSSRGRITPEDDTGASFDPAVTPDGSTVVFFDWNPGQQRVGRVQLDGRGQEWLTGEHVEAGYPDISSGGDLLAYVGFHDDGRDVFVRTLATGEERVLVEDATLPTFSPDGRLVAVARTRSFTGGIGVVGVAGGEVRWLTVSGTWPVWLPDGSAIAYADRQGDARQAVWSVSPDGGPPRRIGDFVWNDHHHPFDIDPRTGAIIASDSVAERTELWLAEYD